MKLISSVFASGGDIPTPYTCEGGDHAPPLAWSEVPAGTKSFALIVDDPDAPDPKAPKMVFVHWLAYDIPAATRSLPEGGKLPDEAREGVNDWKRTGYGGPCPPIGRHRYFFTLYALDAPIGDLKNPKKPELLQAMKGHVLAKAELIGTYIKTKPSPAPSPPPAPAPAPPSKK
jgi:Raf kinase inhibitor-like YbhB/YbcL family protein